MVNKYTVGGVIFGIFLLAIAGINSASNWLKQGNSTNNTQDSITSINGNNTRSQSNRVISQADGTTANNSADLTISPLREAGTYIQRQKRVEQDAVIAQTDVNVIPNTTAAQGNTTADPQPPVTAAPNTRTTQPTATSQPTAPAPAVPALW